MKRLFSILITVFVMMLFLTGCDKNTTGALENQTQEEADLQEFVTDDEVEFLYDWGIDDGSESNMYNGYSSFTASFSKIMEPIDNVVRFGRIINERSPRTLVVRRLSEDTAKVAVERVLGGHFFIFEKITSDSADGDTLVRHRKQLRHVVRRQAIFVKRNVGQADDTTGTHGARVMRGLWRLDAVSLSQGNSPQSTIRIHEVEVTSENGYSETFTDPLETIINIPEDLPLFVRGEEVTVRIKLTNETANPVYDPVTNATETVLLHFGTNPRHHARKVLEYKGVDPATGLHVYEGSWEVHEPAFRPYHAIFDVIDNGTIYDSDEEIYPYNSTTWGIPYIVIFSRWN